VSSIRGPADRFRDARAFGFAVDFCGAFSGPFAFFEVGTRRV
jgi:hypothetical protein